MLCFWESYGFGYGIVEIGMREEIFDTNKNIDLSLDLGNKTEWKLEVPNEVVAVFGNTVEII